MRTQDSNTRFRQLPFVRLAIVLAALVVSFAATPVSLGQVVAAVVDPLAQGPVDPDLFTGSPVVKQAERTAPMPKAKQASELRLTNFQPGGPKLPAPAKTEVQPLPPPAGAALTPKDPCAAVPSKPLNELGIGIAQPEGKLPTDLAGPCWEQINQTNSAARCWSISSYNWEATCFYHNPLYFEEINAERYGYQCGDRSWCCTYGRECCLQPAASAAHFFGTIPALPYCLVAECPTEHVYTLGHYRPGNCNPWQRHWPPCDPVAAASAGGIWTGLIFAIP